MAGSIEADQTLDTKGLSCPLPLLKMKQQLNRMACAQVLYVEATDAGSLRDFEVFAKQTGHQILKQESHEGVYRYWIKKN